MFIVSNSIGLCCVQPRFTDEIEKAILCLMDNVEFDDGSSLEVASPMALKRSAEEHQPSLFVRWLLKIGIIKDSNQAIYIYLIIAFVCILGAVFIFYKSYREGPFRPQSPYELPPK